MMTDQPKAITKSNYDIIKDVARAKETIDEFSRALGVSPKHAMGFISSALIAVSNNPRLMDCTASSIMHSALRAASLGLTCDPEFGHAWLVPYNDRRSNTAICTFQAGYKGYIHLAERTNKYRYINTGSIFEGQTIEEDQLTGKTRIVGTRRSMDAKIVGYFNHFEMMNGFSHTLYMTVAEIDAHGKRYAPSYNDPKGKWAVDFDSMARKTVTKLNLKHYGYFSPNERAMLEDDERLDPAGYVDAQFKDYAEPAEEEKQTEAEILAGMGFDPEQPKPKQPEQAPVTQSHNGSEYASMDIPALAGRHAHYIKEAKSKAEGATDETRAQAKATADYIESLIKAKRESK
jgi:recombination protein RecT